MDARVQSASIVNHIPSATFLSLRYHVTASGNHPASEVGSSLWHCDAVAQRTQRELKECRYVRNCFDGILNSQFIPAKKEAKRLEKEAKVAAKAAKAVTTPAGERKVKEKAAKEEVVPFVNTTPKGQKKGESVRWI